MFTYVAKPACTLVITRRLHHIISLRSLEAATKRQVRLTFLGLLLNMTQHDCQRRWEIIFDFSLLLGLPTLVVGVFCGPLAQHLRASVDNDFFSQIIWFKVIASR